MGLKESWKAIVDWWCENISYNQKKLSKGFSWLLVVLISNLITPITAWLSGGVADWRSYAIIAAVAGIGYGIMVVESVFGAPESPNADAPVIPTGVAPTVVQPVEPEPVIPVEPEPVEPV